MNTTTQKIIDSYNKVASQHTVSTEIKEQWQIMTQYEIDDAKAAKAYYSANALRIVLGK